MGLVLTISINLTFSEMAESLPSYARLAAFYLGKKVFRYRGKHHRIFWMRMLYLILRKWQNLSSSRKFCSILEYIDGMVMCEYIAM